MSNSQFTIASLLKSREELLEELKKKSRRDYLKKRQSDKLLDLEAEIRDEENFFGEDE